MKRQWLIVAITAALSAAANAGQIAPNMPAPGFSLKDLGGKPVTLDSYRGKVVILNFWATWCPPCRAEIPDFVDVYNANKVKGLEIIGVSVDTIPAAQVLTFVQKYKITYPVAMFSKKIVGDYGPIDAIPTTFIIDKTGRVRHTQVGILEKETLEGWVSKLSAEK
jgi:peroxiredoxin